MLALGAALLVVIVVKPDPAPEHAQALEAACSSALEGTCKLQSEGDEQAADVVAIVSLDGGTSRAIVQVGRALREQQNWHRRTLDFAPEDDAVERFRAIGLTIATLAGDAKQQPSHDLEIPKPAKPAALPKPPGRVVGTRRTPKVTKAPAPSMTFPWLRISASALTGPGLALAPWRAGAALRSSLRLWRPALEPTASVSYAASLGDYRGLYATWMGLSAGMLISTTYARLDLLASLRVEGALEGLFVRQREPADRGSRWVGGGLVGGDVVWPQSGMFAGYFHADLVSLTGGTALTSGGERLARNPGNGFRAGVGIELRIH